MSDIHTINGTETVQCLTADTLAAYEQDGALLVRDFFSANDIATVTEDLAKRVQLLDGQPGFPRTIEDISQRVIDIEDARPGSQSVLYDAMNQSPAMHRIGASRRLSSLLEQLLSPTIEIHQRYIVLMSMPRSEWHLAAWHQDWYYNEGPTSTITVYAPLQKTTEDNGSLQLALGEHTRGVLPHGENDHGIATKWQSVSPSAVDKFERVVDTEVNGGDVLLFNSLVPHTARMNQSDHIRFVINLRYRDLSDTEFLEAGWRITDIKHARNAMAREAPRRKSA